MKLVISLLLNINLKAEVSILIVNFDTESKMIETTSNHLKTEDKIGFQLQLKAMNISKKIFPLYYLGNTK